MSGDQLQLQVDADASQTRRFRSLIGEFLRHEFSRARAQHGRYEICVDITHPVPGPGFDSDNVARAVLDAVNGVIFQDESRVDRMVVNKIDGDHPRVSVIARPITLPEPPPMPVRAQPRRIRVLEDV
jgi:crossover junction endodeoxyribonuclease RusA